MPPKSTKNEKMSQAKSPSTKAKNAALSETVKAVDAKSSKTKAVKKEAFLGSMQKLFKENAPKRGSIGAKMILAKLTHQIVFDVAQRANLLIDCQNKKNDKRKFSLNILNAVLDSLFPEGSLKYSKEFAMNAVSSYKEGKEQPSSIKKKISTSKRANISLTPPKVRNILKTFLSLRKIGGTVPIYLSAFIEHMLVELITSALSKISKDTVRITKTTIVKEIIDHPALGPNYVNAIHGVLVVDSKVDMFRKLGFNQEKLDKAFKVPKRKEKDEERKSPSKSKPRKSPVKRRAAPVKKSKTVKRSPPVKAAKAKANKCK